MCKVTIASTVNKYLCCECLKTILILDNYRANLLALHLTADHCRVHIHIYTRLKYHALTAEFVELNIKVNISLRPLNKCSAHALQTTNKLPWNTTNNKLVVLCKYAYRRNITDSSHTAQKAVSLNNRHLSTFACCGNSCNKTCRASTNYNYIVLTCKWCHFTKLLIDNIVIAREQIWSYSKCCKACNGSFKEYFS